MLLLPAKHPYRLPFIGLLLLALAPLASGADAGIGTVDDFEGPHDWVGNVVSLEVCTCLPLACCPGTIDLFGTSELLGGPGGLFDTFLQVQELPNLPSVEVWNESMDWTGDYGLAGIDGLDVHLSNQELLGGNLTVRVGVEAEGTRWVTSDAAAPTLVLPLLWSHHSFAFDEAEMTRVAGSDSLADVLAAVEEVRIFHAPSAQWYGAAGPAMGIDNVELVPEPGRVAALAACFGWLTFLAGRRRAGRAR